MARHESSDWQTLDDERGTYIGPVDRDEALNILRGVTQSRTFVLYPENGFRWWSAALRLGIRHHGRRGGRRRSRARNRVRDSGP